MGMCWTGLPDRTTDQIGNKCPKNDKDLSLQGLWTICGQFLDIFRTFFDILSWFCFSENDAFCETVCGNFLCLQYFEGLFQETVRHHFFFSFSFSRFLGSQVFLDFPTICPLQRYNFENAETRFAGDSSGSELCDLHLNQLDAIWKSSFFLLRFFGHCNQPHSQNFGGALYATASPPIVLYTPPMSFRETQSSRKRNLEDRNLLKLRSLDSSCPFLLSGNRIWGQWTQMLQMLRSQG